MSKIKKNINCYVKKMDQSVKDELKFIIKRSNAAKNIISQQFSSISSFLLVKDSRKNIRDVWTANGDIDKFGISKRYVRNAIEDSIGNIKANWTNVFTKVRTKISKHKKFTKEEKYYLRYMLKSDKLIYNILNRIEIEIPEKFNGLNFKKLDNFLRRNIRLNLPKSHYKDDGSIMIDEQMYSQDGRNLYITGQTKGERLHLLMNVDTKLSGNIRLKFDEKDRLVVSKAINIRTHKNENTNEIGIDRNYINVFDTDTEHSYGEGFNDLLNFYTDQLSAKNKERMKYHNQVKNLKDFLLTCEDSLKKKTQRKIDNIYKYNLGYKKYNKKQKRLKEGVNSHINHSIKEMFKKEMVSDIVMEQLNFQCKKKKNRSRKSNQKMSGWTKGVVRDRIEYKASHQNIRIHAVNAVCTSQECVGCHSKGVKLDNIFYCLSCGRVEHSGHASAKIIKQRKYDKDIKLESPPYIVKQILHKRLLDNDLPSNWLTSEPEQPRPNS